VVESYINTRKLKRVTIASERKRKRRSKRVTKKINTKGSQDMEKADINNEDNVLKVDRRDHLQAKLKVEEEVINQMKDHI
jgi:hypothetical protein